MAATRFDPRPELWDTERRVELEAVVLGEGTLARLARAGGGDPVSVRAGLLEATAERGALPAGTSAVVVGVLQAAGPAAPTDPPVGTRVAVAAPADVLPLWLAETARWSGLAPVVPARGHAVLGPHVPLVRLEGETPSTAACLVPWLGLLDGRWGPPSTPTATAAVLGADHVAGLLAVDALVAAGWSVHATVADLPAARIVQAAGAVPVVVGASDPAALETEVTASLARAHAGTAELVVVAPPSREDAGAPVGEVGDVGGALAAGALAAPDGRVVVLRPADAPPAVASLDARGCPAQVVAQRTAPTRPTTLGDVASRTLEVARWHAGDGPRPSSARPEDV
ncbi:MAG: hypothetical protein ACLGIR_02930 [Actinomycetes bacterium]